MTITDAMRVSALDAAAEALRRHYAIKENLLTFMDIQFRLGHAAAGDEAGAALVAIVAAVLAVVEDISGG